MKKSVFIATPTYDARVHVQYMMSCVEAVINLKSDGHTVYLVPNLSTTLLILGRNTLIEEFIKSGASHIMCIDSDLGFDPTAIRQLLNANKEIICGVYPARKAQTFIYNPQYNEDGSYISDKDDPYLIKANMAPAGFMLITREAIIKMQKHFPELYYEPKTPGAGDTGFLLFNTEIVGGAFWSEDYVFCKRARDAGIDVWIDPRLTFDHAGNIGGLHMLPEIKAFLESRKAS